MDTGNANMEEFKFKNNSLKILFWIVVLNAAILAVFIPLGIGWIYFGLIVLVFTMLWSLGSLFFSKHYVKKNFDIIKIIDENNLKTQKEKEIYDIVKSLSKKANLKAMPEVAIYKGPANAFTVGFNRNNSIIAISDELIEAMDNESLASVIGHEMGHILSSDSVIMSIMNAAIWGAIIIFISIPAFIIKFIITHDDEYHPVMILLTLLMEFIAVRIFLFFAGLLKDFYSRKREFKADLTGAKLVSFDAMSKALKTLQNMEDSLKLPTKQQPYAALMITSPKRFLDIFSDHPSTDRRLKALSDYQTKL